MKSHTLTFQFLAQPTDVNFGGKVHGGTVMTWIDQTGYACARNWAGSYCVTVYVGGIKFYKAIHIGEIVRVDATILHTGSTSMHMVVEVFSKPIEADDFVKKTQCIIVFVAVDAKGKPTAMPKWTPETEVQKKLEQYVIKLKKAREEMIDELEVYLP